MRVYGSSEGRGGHIGVYMRICGEKYRLSECRPGLLCLGINTASSPSLPIRPLATFYHFTSDFLIFSLFLSLSLSFALFAFVLSFLTWVQTDWRSCEKGLFGEESVFHFLFSTFFLYIPGWAVFAGAMCQVGCLFKYTFFLWIFFWAYVLVQNVMTLHVLYLNQTECNLFNIYINFFSPGKINELFPLLLLIHLECETETFG